MKFLIINGPNLNKLGEREPQIYGDMTLTAIRQKTDEEAKKQGVYLDWMQSSREGEIIDFIHTQLLSMNSQYNGLIINPAGYSHTSIAILDALKMVQVPIVEVHLSNIYRRESFRQNLLTAGAATIIMSGVGNDGYILATYALLRLQQSALKI